MSIRVDSNLISLALAATRMEYQLNSTETKGIAFLAQVAGQLDVMDIEASLKLMEALDRMVGLM